MLFKGLSPVSGGVCCYNARGNVPTGSPIPRPVGRGIGRPVHTSPSAKCQQNSVSISAITWQFLFQTWMLTLATPTENMVFNAWAFRVLLPLFRLVVWLNDGISKGRRIRDVPHNTFDIGGLNRVKQFYHSNIYLQWFCELNWQL